MKWLIYLLCIGFVLFVVFLPAINRAWSRAEREYYMCSNQLKAIHTAIVEYASKNGGKLPDADKWCDAIQSYLPKAENESNNGFRCPFDKSKGEQISSYAMNSQISGYPIDQLTKDTVFIFESKPGWNQAGGTEIMSYANHRYLMQPNRCMMIFPDGLVEFDPQSQPRTFRWKP
jgi:hypothetical protein